MKRDMETVLKRYLVKHKKIDDYREYAVIFSKRNNYDISEQLISEIEEYIQPYALVRYFKDQLNKKE